MASALAYIPFVDKDRADTREQIIEDALSHGRSLAWQERWVASVQAGIADADSGNFAFEEESAAVLNRFGS